MKGQNGAAALAILEAAAIAGPDTDGSGWESVMLFLDLPLCYQPAVVMALAEGRWRDAHYPRAYVRTVALREASRLRLAEDKFEDMHLPVPLGTSHDEYLDGIEGKAVAEDLGRSFSSSFGDSEEDDVEDRLTGYTFDRVHKDREGRRIPTVAGILISLECLTPDPEEPERRLVLDWGRIADLSGLDDYETEILEMRLQGETRECILKEMSRDEGDRLRLQAAWKRLDRKMAAIRAVLSGTPPSKPASKNTSSEMSLSSAKRHTERNRRQNT